MAKVRKEKALSTKEFAEQQLKEIRQINDEVRKRTRKLILVASAANAMILLVMFIVVWYMKIQ